MISVASILQKLLYIWVRSWRCGCLVTWFCYQLIAKAGIKTAAPSWPHPYSFVYVLNCDLKARVMLNRDTWINRWSLFHWRKLIAIYIYIHSAFSIATIYATCCNWPWENETLGYLTWCEKHSTKLCCWLCINSKTNHGNVGVWWIML